MADKIIFRDLQVQTILGDDSWESAEVQPLLVTAEMHTSISLAGKADKVTDSVHYGTARKRVTAFAESNHDLQSLEAFAEEVARVCLNVTSRALAVYMVVRSPRALLHAEYAAVEIYRTRKDAFGSWSDSPADEELSQQAEHVVAERAAAVRAAKKLSNDDCIVIKKLSLNTIIGVKQWERRNKQALSLDLVLYVPKAVGEAVDVHNNVVRCQSFRAIVKKVSEMVEQTSYRTLEALATAIAQVAIKECN
ncbi:trifunctional dihydropteroate synthetase, partial [Coemansia sp. RSA 2618]